MKWMLVVLVGGVSPVNADLAFDKFSDCLAAEEQMRQHYADAFEAWDRMAAARIDRRRDYKKAREVEAKRLLSNVGTCVPHGGGISSRSLLRSSNLPLRHRSSLKRNPRHRSRRHGVSGSDVSL